MLTKREYQKVVVALEMGCEVTHEEASTSVEEPVIMALTKVSETYGDKAELMRAYFAGEIKLNAIAEYVIRTENKSVKIP